MFIFTTRKGNCGKVMFLPPATKLGQGYIFTGVCDSVHRGGLPQCMLGYHPPPRQGRPPARRPPWQGRPPPGRADPHSPHQGDIDRRYSQQAGGMRPTGMQFLLHLSVSHFVRGGVRGRGVCMAGGHEWQERRPLKRAVCILLECIRVLRFMCFVNDGHAFYK